ncbi:MAG: alpha/beta fold hydrolase [Ignavibacteria bacterium]|nr:alpha/beta fold hydrolase [Ignavibacteria bacterium]
MKKFYFLILLLCLSGITEAQFDNKFYKPSKELKPLDLNDYEELMIQRDSIQLSCLFIKTKESPKGTVLFFHGAGGNISTYTFITKPLSENGYQVFMVDFRGYGKSNGSPGHINIADDAQFIFDYVTKREKFKNTKLIIFGASLGCQIAAKITRDNQKSISALVLDGAFTSFTDIACEIAPAEQREYITQFLKSPYSVKEDIKYIESVPKLIVHSREDEVIPVYMADTIYQNAMEPKIFWLFKGGHLEAMPLYTKEYIEKIDGLLNN